MNFMPTMPACLPAFMRMYYHNKVKHTTVDTYDRSLRVISCPPCLPAFMRVCTQRSTSWWCLTHATTPPAAASQEWTRMGEKRSEEKRRVRSCLYCQPASVCVVARSLCQLLVPSCQHENVTEEDLVHCRMSEMCTCYLARGLQSTRTCACGRA